MDFDKALIEHGDLYLFTTTEGRASFRLLDYKTVKAFTHVMLSYPEFKCEIEDKVWDECVLEHTFSHPRDFLPAGLVTSIAQSIIYMSSTHSISDINKGMDEERITLSDAREQAILTICEAFPSYTPEMVEDMTWKKILKRLVQAEVLLKRELEFKSAASQQQDDSAKIFNRLNENVSVDFTKVNNELHSEEYGKPVGDFNLNSIRGR